MFSLHIPGSLRRPGFLSRREVQRLEAGDGGVAQAVKVDAVSVAGVRHVWHRVTRVPTTPALTRVQTLGGPMSPELDGPSAIIENISVICHPAMVMTAGCNCVSNAGPYLV